MTTKAWNALFATIVLLLSVIAASAQAPKDDLCSSQPHSVPCQFKANLAGLKATITQIKNSAASPADKETQIRQEFTGRHHLELIGFALVLAKEPREAYVKAIENARVDKQVGTVATSSGSTSLVSKASVPAILGFAVENGALQKDTSGTTLTFRGNPVGIVVPLVSFCKAPFSTAK